MATLQFVLGSASFDHQQVMLDRLAAQYQQAPNDTYLYLVPNHVKFTTEVAVLKGLKKRLKQTGNYAQANVAVLSFSRLGVRTTPITKSPAFPTWGWRWWSPRSFGNSRQNPPTF